jgi:hypothetical protein
VLPWTTAAAQTAGAGRVGNKKPTQKKPLKKTLKMSFFGFFGFFGFFLFLIFFENNTNFSL